MYKQILLTFSLLFLLFLLPNIAQAAGSCQTVYNGGTTCPQSGEITIDKTVQNPTNKNFYDNVYANDYIFAKGQQVVFHLTLGNNNTSTVNNITALDTLPPNLDFVRGDGIFDTQKRVVTIKDISLTSKQNKTFTITTQVNDQPIPDGSVSCLTNQTRVQTTSFFFFSSPQNQDGAIFCIGSSAAAFQPVTPQSNQTDATAHTTITTQVTPHSSLASPQTKGGKVVYVTPTVQKNPATGAEPLSLLAIPILFALGRHLRSKTRIA